mgnify:CR=1 FL=1
MPFKLTSTAFDAGESIPLKHTCEGQDVSPPLAWEGAPSEAEELVLICDDPDAPNGTWSHWVLYHIPAGQSSLPEGVPAMAELPWGGVQGRNNFGNIGYGGPCPPRGSTHRYYFRLYALDQALDMPSGATRQQVLDRMEGHILGKTELMGRFTRS